MKQFWTREFPSYSANLKGEALAPVLNKLGAFVANPVIRNIIGQERSRIDLIDLMERRAIIFVPLATGRIGEDASHLLGGLLLAAVQLAVMERPRGSPPFMLYADEFQHYVTDSVATILAESRKFGLGLTLAHQYLGQLTDTVRDAVLGNVGNMAVFRIGGEDAAALECEFEPVFTAYDLANLPRYQTAMKLVARGEGLAPFSAATLQLPLLPPAAAQRRAPDSANRAVRWSNSSPSNSAPRSNSVSEAFSVFRHRPSRLTVLTTATRQERVRLALLGSRARDPPDEQVGRRGQRGRHQLR